MDADSSDNLTEDTSPRTHIYEATPEQRARGAVVGFTHRGAEGWTASGTITRTFKGLVIQHLEVDPAARNESVTAQILRKIPLGEILATAAGSEIVIALVGRLLSQQPAVEPPDDTPRPGRAPLPDDLLERITVGYLAELQGGKGAVKRLAENEDQSPATISRWLHRARQRGWLAAAAQGREGGEPGPRLLALGTDTIAALLVEYLNSHGGNHVVMTPAKPGDPFESFELTGIEPVEPPAE